MRFERCIECKELTGSCATGGAPRCVECGLGPYCERCHVEHKKAHPATPSPGQTMIPGTEPKEEKKTPEMVLTCPGCNNARSVVMPDDPENEVDCPKCQGLGEFKGMAAFKQAIFEMVTASACLPACPVHRDAGAKCTCGHEAARADLLSLSDAISTEDRTPWDFHGPTEIMEYHLYETERQFADHARLLAEQGANGSLYALERLGAVTGRWADTWRKKVKNAKRPEKGACRKCGGKGVWNHPINPCVCDVCGGCGCGHYMVTGLYRAGTGQYTRTCDHCGRTIQEGVFKVGGRARHVQRGVLVRIESINGDGSFVHSIVVKAKYPSHCIGSGLTTSLSALEPEGKG